MKNLKLKLLAVSAIALAVPAQAATTITNGATGGNVGTYGRGGTATYGQVFRAPTSGVLQSFKFWINGVVTGVQGGVGTWNGGLAYATGNGSPTNLFLGSAFNTVAGANTVNTGGLNVIAGQSYVAYLTVFGNPGSGSTSFQLGTANPDLGHFVWNNNTNPVGNPSWNYFANFGNARFEAVFGPAGAVPEPSTWLMLILGFAAVGAAMRRRPKIASVAVSYS